MHPDFTETTPISWEPPAPTRVTDLMTLQDLVNDHLPEGMGVTVKRSDSETLVMLPEGFTVSPENEFVATGVTLDPEHTLTTQVILDSVEIPDVYIDGWELADLLNSNHDTVRESAGAHLYGGTLTVVDATVDHVADQYVEVEMEVTLDVKVTLEDLGISGDERFNDADEARDQVQSLLVRHIASEYSCSERSVSADITESDIGL